MAVLASRVAARASRGRFSFGVLSGCHGPPFQQQRQFADSKKLKMPGVTYSFGGTVYVALTNECTAELTMLAANGPSFTFPEGTGFQALPDNVEPTGEQAAQLALQVIKDLDSKEGAREDGREVVFAGLGEPLARSQELIKALHYLNDHSNRFARVKGTRLNTNGLVKSENATSMANFLKEAGLARACVQLQTADAVQYQDMVRPLHGLNHSDACSFVAALVSAGVTTDVSAIARPGVDLAAVEALALELGATFLKRPYFE